MKNIIKKLVKSIVRCVITKQPVLDIESRTLHYPYRWELFRKFSIKTGYIPVKEYGDEQSEYLKIA